MVFRKSSFVRVVVAGLLLVSCAAAQIKLFGITIFGKKEPQQGTYIARRLNQSAMIEKPQIAAAERTCLNYGWAAAAQSMLWSRDVKLSQEGLVVRSFGGDRCIDRGLDFAALARDISRSYVLDDGRHVGVTAQYSEGAPASIDPLVAALREGHPLMITWNARPLLLTGVVYDEYIGPNGTRMFIVRELKLQDPMAAEEKREVSFVRDRDDPEQINGWMQIEVLEEPRF